MPIRSLVPRSDKETDLALAQKAKKSTKKSVATVKRGGGLSAQIANIKSTVLKNLGQYEDETELIQSEMALYAYITKAIEFGRIAIDTETTGLDPMLDECVGISLYVKGEKTVYIPLNHVNYITGEKYPNQLPKEAVAKELERLVKACTKIVMFNAPFDIRVIKHKIGVRLHCWWDCSVASKLLNENEAYSELGLKPQHRKYVLKGVGDAFKYDDLFKDVVFSYVPIRVAGIYAGHDSKITDELYEFQAEYIYYDPECPYEARDGLNGVSNVFFNIEMPLVDVIVDMEDTGVALDIEYSRELSVKYHTLKEQAVQRFNDLVSECDNAVKKYVSEHPNCKLDTPINISSPAQLSVLFYDILGYQSPDPKKPRGTGKAILKAWNTDISNAVLEYKGVDKLLGTFIDKLPNDLNPNDGRVHCGFNALGAKTGRFSSSHPNLQQIPSHNKDIRPMFVATEGYVLMSSDYSQQEPSALAAYCKELGYENLFNARFKGNDLYSEVAGAIYTLAYELCCEFDKNHHKNPPEYKERRNSAKPLLLGILYGMGDAMIANRMKTTETGAKQFKSNLYKRFPEILIFEEESLKMGKTRGYVTTVCGRKRRLPELQLSDYEIKWEAGFEPDGDILDFDNTGVCVPRQLEKYYISKIRNARGRKQKWAVINEAKQKHLVITDNVGKIGKAERQCVNSRIQGASADLTKIAMIELYNNERLRELGFRILIPVHDEIIAECPEENAKECSKLLAEIMSHAAEEILKMPFSCDVEVSRAWYGQEYVFDIDDEDDEESED